MWIIYIEVHKDAQYRTITCGGELKSWLKQVGPPMKPQVHGFYGPSDLSQVFNTPLGYETWKPVSASEENRRWMKHIKLKWFKSSKHYVSLWRSISNKTPYSSLLTSTSLNWVVLYLKHYFTYLAAAHLIYLQRCVPSSLHSLCCSLSWTKANWYR